MGVIVAAVVSVVVSFVSADAIKDSDIRTARSESYASYVKAHAEFNEFIWAHVDWAGSDATGEQPADMGAQFWSEAARLQADLAASSVQARFLARGGKVEDILIDMNNSQTETFLRFKCMAGIQAVCPPLADGAMPEEATNTQIRTMLEHWSSQSAQNMDALVAAVARQLT